VSSPLNDPPATYEACEWTDLNGNFWIFGGRNGGNYFSDLFKYDPVINEWTWMKGSGTPDDSGTYGICGVASPLNNPPSNGMGVATWTDNQNNLWLYGGLGSYWLFPYPTDSVTRGWGNQKVRITSERCQRHPGP
jgi:hypothetical protein